MTERRSVLVVEDDKMLNELVCRFVEMAGFAARSALDGKSAIATARAHPPNVILLDLMLPDTTGFDVCQQLKSQECTRHVPVVIVTALDDKESRRRATGCGATEYVPKPFDPDLLIATVRKYAA